jgi:PKD repeat protein
MRKITQISAILIMLLGFYNCKQEVAPAPLPVAEFSFRLRDNGEVVFTDLSQNATTLGWDFGNGFTSGERNPTHIYKKNGDYTAILSIGNADGVKASIKKTIKILTVSGDAFFFRVNNTKYNWEVTLNGKTAIIDGAYPTGTPNCGDKYTATFTGLTEATYPYTVREIGGTGKWGGEITVKSGVCNGIRFN